MTVRERLYASVMLIRLEAFDPELARLTRLLIEEADQREREANALIAEHERRRRAHEIFGMPAA